MMSISHFGLTVPNAAKAAAYYTLLLGLHVVVREARVDNSWATVSEDMTDEEARALGLHIGMFVLRRDNIAVSLQETDQVPPQVLEHVALIVPPPEFSILKSRAEAIGCRIFKSSSGRYVFADHFGMIWEITDRDVLLSARDTTGRYITAEGALKFDPGFEKVDA